MKICAHCKEPISPDENPLIHHRVWDKDGHYINERDFYHVNKRGDCWVQAVKEGKVKT